MTCFSPIYPPPRKNCPSTADLLPRALREIVVFSVSWYWRLWRLVWTTTVRAMPNPKKHAISITNPAPNASSKYPGQTKCPTRIIVDTTSTTVHIRKIKKSMGYFLLVVDVIVFFPRLFNFSPLSNGCDSFVPFLHEPEVCLTKGISPVYITPDSGNAL